MSERDYKLYAYRWVVLGVFMFINLTIQILWISYAPNTGPAAEFYGVSDLYIGLQAMSFMIAFIPLSIPVAWVIDTYGFRLAVSIAGRSDGSLWFAARLLWCELCTGAPEYCRHCHRPAVST